MAKALFRLECQASQVSSVKNRLPAFFREEKSAVVFPSGLSEECSVNEHLVWFWGVLQHERRKLKRFKAEGVRLVFECRAKSPLELSPNAAEMLHLLEAELRVEVSHA